MATKLTKPIALLCAAVFGTFSSAAILGSAVAQPSHDGSVHAAKHHRRHHHHHRRNHIPQHNGGDQDSDNNGGPTDGDGNV